jgi:hypothetical protein
MLILLIEKHFNLFLLLLTFSYLNNNEKVPIRCNRPEGSDGNSSSIYSPDEVAPYCRYTHYKDRIKLHLLMYFQNTLTLEKV